MPVVKPRFIASWTTKITPMKGTSRSAPSWEWLAAAAWGSGSDPDDVETGAAGVLEFTAAA